MNGVSRQGDSLAHLWTRGEGCGDPSKEFFGTIIYHVRVDIEGHLHRAPFLSGILYQPPREYGIIKTD